MQVIQNLNTLKAMARAGHINLHNQTGSKIQGLYSTKTFTCYYVDEGKGKFEYKGKTYGVKYFDGCFCPYVVQI